MLSLGSSLSRPLISKKSIVKDNLVLKHDYTNYGIHQVSTGAADINSDADANEYISVGTITIGTGDISVSAWVYVTTFTNLTSTYGGIITNRQTASTSPGIQLRVKNNSTIEMLIDDGGSDSTIASGTLNTHQWYHVCGVWDRSDKQFLYIDGVLVNSGDITNENLTLNHSENVLIGRLDTTGYDFMGYICNVGYWNRTLSQAEVKSIMWKNYANLTSDEKTSLVSWYNLDSPLGGFYSGNGTENLAPTTVYDNHNTTLGSELVTNGDFSNGLTGWTTDGTVSVNTSGVSIFGSTDSDVYIYQDLGSTGNTYKVTFDLVVNDGTIKVGTNADFQYSYSAGTYTNESIYIVPTTSNRFIFRRQSGTLSATLDNVSIKQVNGNIGTLS